jgi:hypothetical protein
MPLKRRRHRPLTMSVNISALQSADEFLLGDIAGIPARP